MGSLFGLSGVPVLYGSFYDRTPNGGHWSHNAASVSDSMIPEMNAVLNLRFRAAPRAREKFGFAHFLFLIARLVHRVPTLALAPKHFTSWAKIAHGFLVFHWSTAVLRSSVQSNKMVPTMGQR